MRLHFTPLAGTFAIARLAPDAAVPEWARGEFVSITRTPDELSIVCDDRDAPPATDRGWRCLKLEGPMPLDTVGVAARFTQLLATAGISCFVVATYDTDYVLVRGASFDAATAVLGNEDDRFTLHHLGGVRASFADDVRHGLAASPKYLFPHYFYDALGSSLFSAICELPEYYVTRAETEILTGNAAGIAEAFGENVRLLELGSGSARKTSIIIDAVLAGQSELEFVAVDVDDSVITSSARELTTRFPRLRVTGVNADFRDPAALAPFLDRNRRNVVLFLGSSIGNLDRNAAAQMLRSLRSILAAGDLLFLGADRKKPREILEPAYDDPLGVTAAFNLNLLARINRELGGTFDLGAFAHSAVYNETEGRIEMYLVSRREQRARAAGEEFAFAEGEAIHTENSYKYDDDDLARLAAAGGFEVVRQWNDSREWFTDLLLAAR